MPTVFAATPVDLTFAVPAVAIIVVMLLGAMGMVASAISNPQLEAWVKTEIRELVAGLILVVIVVGFFAVTGNDIAATLTGKPAALTTNGYVNSALVVLDNWTVGYDAAFVTAIKAAAKIRVGATYAPYISIPLWYVGLNYATSPLAGVAILLLPLNMAAGGLTNAMFIARGIRMLIVFVAVTGPPILLPLSLCLRLIPFSRKLGNTMIAVSLAGLVLLPVSVLIADSLNGTLVDAQGHSTVPKPYMDLSVIDENRPWSMTVFQPVCSAVPLRAILGMTEWPFALIVCLPLLLGVVTAAAYPACVSLVANVIYPIIMVVFQLINAILLIAWEVNFSGTKTEAYASAVFDQVFNFLKDVNNLVFLGYIDFIIIAIITVVGARSLSTALGGEWYLAGIQRLI
jgi:hypothetical protein